MKVLLVNGSKHEKGCTYTALSEVAKALNENGVETEIFQLSNLTVSGCKGCWACKKTKKCVGVRRICFRLARVLCVGVGQFGQLYGQSVLQRRQKSCLQTCVFGGELQTCGRVHDV